MNGKALQKFVFYVIGAGILTAIGTYFVVRTETGQLFGPVPIAMAIGSTLLQLGAVWYFLASLKTFKPGLKAAYSMLSLGILVFTLIQIQLLLVVFVTITPSLLVANLLVIVPYLLSAALIYAAMMKFSSLLGLRGSWTNLAIVLAIAAIVGGVFVVVPHPTLPVDEGTLNLVMGGISVAGVISIGAMFVALRIQKVIGAVYKSSTIWMSLALAAMAFLAFHEFITKIYFQDLSYVALSYSAWPFVLTGVLFLMAGILFKQTGHGFIKLPANATHIDIITAAAQMAANPAAINNQLDKLRSVTAHMGPNDELSAADKATLSQLYVYIEDYLVTKEPLQFFTREGLRNGLPEFFLKELPPNSTSQAPTTPTEAKPSNSSPAA